MRLQVKQWGNSKAIRLPKDFISSMNLKMDDYLELEQIDSRTIKLMVIPKVQEKKRLTLAERIALTESKKLPVCEEWDSLTSSGNEI